MALQVDCPLRVPVLLVRLLEARRARALDPALVLAGLELGISGLVLRRVVPVRPRR